MLERISEWLMRRANDSDLRLTSPEFYQGIMWLSAQVPHLEDPLPSRGICPECGGVSGVLKPEHRLCKGSADYRAGLRAIWTCTNPDCGEMEVR